MSFFKILVRVKTAGVNPVETYIRSGTYARLPSLPYIPGGDGAGVVDKVGPGIDASSFKAAFLKFKIYCDARYEQF